VPNGILLYLYERMLLRSLDGRVSWLLNLCSDLRQVPIVPKSSMRGPHRLPSGHREHSVVEDMFSSQLKPHP
jgi:hypothetical protein